MPIGAALIPAAISAGASLYAGSQQQKVANKSLGAQTRANDRSLELQRETRDMARDLQSPFIQGGYGAFDALLQELGIQSAAPSGGKTPGGMVVDRFPAERGPTPDYQAYWDANPDLAADPSLANANPGDLTGDGQVNDADRAALHYQQYGQGEGRALPTSAPAPGQPLTPQDPSPASPPTDLMTAERPAATPAPTFNRPDDAALPTVTRSVAPAYQAPAALNPFTFDASRIAEDPGYQFRLDESLKGVNAASAARGKLRSGDAAAALMSRASGLASQETASAFARQLAGYQQNAGQYNTDRAFGYNSFLNDRNRTDANFNTDRAFGEDRARYQQGRSDQNYSDDRAYDTSMWQYGQDRTDRNFNTDRGYQANRYDTRIGNLFSLANTGQQAAGAVTGAQTNYANNAGNIFSSQAQAASDAAAQRGAANAQMVGSLSGIGANLFANWGGGQPRAQPSQLPGGRYGNFAYGTF